MLFILWPKLLNFSTRVCKDGIVSLVLRSLLKVLFFLFAGERREKEYAWVLTERQTFRRVNANKIYHALRSDKYCCGKTSKDNSH